MRELRVIAGLPPPALYCIIQQERGSVRENSHVKCLAPDPDHDTNPDHSSQSPTH